MAKETKLFMASADGHVGLPTKAYRKYIPTKFHADFDEYLAHHRWVWSPSSFGSIVKPEHHDRMREIEGYDVELGTPVVWDAALRLQAYDQDAIAAEVLVPDDQSTNDPPWGAGLATGGYVSSIQESYSPEWIQRGAEAYNRWLSDFCSVDRRRLRGLTILGTLANVDWAIAEARRAYDDGLTTGVLLPLDYSLPLYHHSRYDRLWAALEEMDLTVVSHLSKGGPEWVGDNINTISAIWLLEADWYAQRPVWCLILGGVLERFPKLRLVVEEIGIDWVAPLLSRLDSNWEPTSPFKQFAEDNILKMKPSDYFQRQCFVAHSAEVFIRRSDLESGFLKIIPNMIWGSDLGHGEGFWPNGLARLTKLISGLNSCEMRKYLGENIHSAFPVLRRDNYEDIIDRIAPTPAALGLVA